MITRKGDLCSRPLAVSLTPQNERQCAYAHCLSSIQPRPLPRTLTQLSPVAGILLNSDRTEKGKHEGEGVIAFFARQDTCIP